MSGKWNGGFAPMFNNEDDIMDPFQYRLLGHYRRRCGDDPAGTCHERAAKTCATTQMSRLKMFNTRDWLVRNGFITLEDHLGRPTIIRVVDQMATRIKNDTGTHSENDTPGIAKTTHLPVSNSHHISKTLKAKPLKQSVVDGEDIFNFIKSLGYADGPAETMADEAITDGLTAEEIKAVWGWVQAKYGIENPKGLFRAELRKGRSGTAMVELDGEAAAATAAEAQTKAALERLAVRLDAASRRVKT